MGRIGVAVGALGLLVLAAGAVLAEERAWANLLLAGWALTGFGLGGAFFLALCYAADATWPVAFRRVPEAMTRALPGAAVLLAVLFVLHPSLYPWTYAEPVAAPGFRQFWLSRGFFLVRAAVYFGIWIALATAIVRNSRRQDADGSPVWSRRNARLSAIFLVVFGVTCFLASVDWVMSLTPEWYSTMFGVYNFAGLFQSGLAVTIVLVVWLKRAGPLAHVLNEEHLHDLGKLLFAFSTFWMYVWFSQYMLIWYANITEETVYFIPRTSAAWQPLIVVNIVLNWVVPFLVIMGRAFKRQASMLVRVAAVVLVGRWLDLYLMILPSQSPASPPVGLWEVGGVLAAGGLLLAAFAQAFREAAPVPAKDPFLAESLHYHS